MSHQSTHGRRNRRAFLSITLAAVVSAVIQISLGGIVRITESGLGCPDWPLCHGQVIPPLEASAIIEYSHRLSATALGLLVLASAYEAWRTHRNESRVIFFSTLGAVLTFIAAFLGAASVLTELAWWIVLLHLAVAELVVACLIIAWFESWKITNALYTAGKYTKEPTKPSMLILLTLTATFILILNASYMVGMGYGSVCGTWPLCRGILLPMENPYLVHMSHRIAVLVVGLLIICIVKSAWSRRLKRPDIAWASLAVAALYLVQLLIGATIIWTGFSMHPKALHLGIATIVWGSLVALYAMTWASSQRESGKV